MDTKVFRTIQDLIDFIEAKGYSLNRSKGSHRIYSALNKTNIILVSHNNPKSERAHPKTIKDVLTRAS